MSKELDRIIEAAQNTDEDPSVYEVFDLIGRLAREVKRISGPIVSDDLIVERARYCRDYGNFDTLHAELLQAVERMVIGADGE